MEACSILAHDVKFSVSFDVIDGISEVWCHAYTFDVDCSDDKYNVDGVSLDADNELNQDFKHALNDKDLWFLLNKLDKIRDLQIHLITSLTDVFIRIHTLMMYQEHEDYYSDFEDDYDFMVQYLMDKTITSHHCQSTNFFAAMHQYRS